MAKYKILKEFILNGIVQKIDSVVEFDYQIANLKSIQGNIEKMPDDTTPSNGSVLDSLVPGKELTPEQKEKLAKENAEATAEAQRLAGEQRAKDQAEGRGEPTAKVVADSLKSKLENEQFENKGANPPAPPTE